MRRFSALVISVLRCDVLMPCHFATQVRCFSALVISLLRCDVLVRVPFRHEKNDHSNIICFTFLVLRNLVKPKVNDEYKNTGYIMMCAASLISYTAWRNDY